MHKSIIPMHGWTNIKLSKLSCLSYPQAMYASVHDAALVVGTAVQNLMNSDEGMEAIDSHFTNSDCPLRSTLTRHEPGLGWKLMQQIRKVNTLPTYSYDFYTNLTRLGV